MEPHSDTRLPGWQPPVRAPWVERLVQIGRNLGDDGRSLVCLDADALLAAAEGATGLSTWGGDSFREPLAVLCRALEEEAQLHLLGRIFARSELQRVLQARLGVVDWCNRHPQVAREPVERPVFITGLGRSGTTLLHELLAQDPANRVPHLWEMFFPIPPPHDASTLDDPRIDAAEREITLMDATVPAFTAMHENAGGLPNECIFLFAQELVTDLFTGEFRVPSYTMWVSACNMGPVYATHRRMLQLLQSRDRRERWVLKAPSHLSQLPALLAEYPDARIVWTHRDPLRVVGSLCNLMATLHWMRSDYVDYAAIVTAISFGMPYLCEKVMQQRKTGAVPEDRITDVLYAELVRDPLACVRRIYEGWGETLSVDAEARMREFLEARASGRAGSAVHEYDFATTGLDLRSERTRVADYQERYAVPSEV